MGSSAVLQLTFPSDCPDVEKAPLHQPHKWAASLPCHLGEVGGKEGMSSALNRLTTKSLTN